MSRVLQDEMPLLLCFSHLRWGFVWQRPQHLLSRAARHYRVFYFEEPVFRADVTVPELEIIDTKTGVTLLVPHLPLGLSGAAANAVLIHLVDDFLAQQRKPPDILWYYTPSALTFTRHLSARLCFYDCMDQLSAFLHAPDNLSLLEDELFAKADSVTCGGRMLFEDKRQHHSNAHLFPSSIDAAHFRKARSLRQSRPAHDVPVLGFFGVIDERLDLHLVEEIARARPEWTMQMIGPVAKIDAASLPRRPNIFWQGAIDYQDLPDHLAGFDLGIMPFAINEATHFISPTKTPEFLAAGLPLISTPIRDVVTPYGEAGLVEIGTTAAAFVAGAERLLMSPDPRWQQKVDQFLSTTSWDQTWAGIHALLAPRAHAPRRRVEAVGLRSTG